MRVRPLNFKQIQRSVATDESAICHVKINPAQPPVQTDAGAEITLATVEGQANLIDLQVNGGAETVIGTYTGNTGADNQVVYGDAGATDTVAGVIAALNGVAAGQTAAVRRWRAGLGDFRPQFVLGAGDGDVIAPTNAMLGNGNVEGFAVLAESTALASVDMLAIGLGTDRARAGRGQQIPDHLESDYESTTAGVKTPIRSAARKIEDQPGQASYQVVLTDLQVGALFASTKVATVFDNAGNTLMSWALGAATAIPNSGLYTAENPAVVGPPGSPLFIEITGTGAFTDGTCTAIGYERLA